MLQMIPSCMLIQIPLTSISLIIAGLFRVFPFEESARFGLEAPTRSAPLLAH